MLHRSLMKMRRWRPRTRATTTAFYHHAVILLFLTICIYIYIFVCAKWVVMASPGMPSPCALPMNSPCISMGAHVRQELSPTSYSTIRFGPSLGIVGCISCSMVDMHFLAFRCDKQVGSKMMTYLGS